MSNLQIGDRVKYIGSRPNLKTQYAGALKIWQMGKGCDRDKCACLTPGGKVTSWIEFVDLEVE